MRRLACEGRAEISEQFKGKTVVYPPRDRGSTPLSEALIKSPSRERREVKGSSFYLFLNVIYRKPYRHA